MRPRTRSFIRRNANGVSKIRRVDYKKTWPELVREVKKRDGYRCRGRNCGSEIGLEVHHIVPLSRGGTNHKTNLITLCEKCHLKRHRHLQDRG